MTFLRIDNFTTSEATITWPDKTVLALARWNDIPVKILNIKLPLRYYGKLRPKKGKAFSALSIRQDLDPAFDLGRGKFWKVSKDLGEVLLYLVLDTEISKQQL